jgi:DNA relaxase NicK
VEQHLEAGIDWVSVTLPPLVNDAPVYLHRVQDMVLEQKAAGHILKQVDLLGYKGIKCGGAFVGVSHQGIYVQVAGALANTVWHLLQHEEARFTRLDCQVTERVEPPDPRRGRRVHNDAVTANSKLSVQRRRKLVEISGSDGGYTLYIGAPTSLERSRLYNKEVQSEDPAYRGAWRWEVQLRNVAARTIAKNMPLDPVGRTMYCAGFVQAWYRSRGCDPGWEDVYGYKVASLQPQRVTDAEKRLAWLRSQVRPACRWLIDNGYGEYIGEALGIATMAE